MDLRAQVDPNIVIVGDMNTPLSPIDRSSREKINKETLELLHTLDKMHIVDIYRVFHPTTILFCSSRNFLQPSHILGHKESINNSRKLK
jgi:hypothetical protein